ncbi:RNA polymerase sigma factor [Oceanibaculum pacificum]|uniref:RNA polymerase sigma-70 region 2 domain-containing protein n=1 Tax=Oceanibaculum pacificum TaxID=580166 RepID=A0A154VS03_9PROT|nr:RNA polymerase sigma factor [Oceanibaculum pacificum]KZD04117.1 hypothetical protein AUP43_03155 [Oceanibaculum pacificum]
MVGGNDIKRLFLAHRGELQAYLTRKLRNADVAAELTQETFLRFAEHSGSPAAITPISHDRSYLYRVAHNLAVDYVRGQRRENADSGLEDRLAETPDDAPSPEQVACGQSEPTPGLTSVLSRKSPAHSLARKLD